MEQNVSLTGGVDNLFDKRLWREGNAQTVRDTQTGAYMAGLARTPITSARTYVVYEH